MSRSIARSTRFGSAVSLAALLGVGAVIADEPAPSPLAPQQASALAKVAVQITDAVLEHHIDPPARQQMLLTGINALYRAADVPQPAGLGRRVSMITTPEQLAALLADVWPKPAAKGRSSDELESAFRDGLLQSVAGDAELISAKERKVAEQFEGNRYVGIHVALAFDGTEKRPRFHQVFEGGPADKAGVKKDDIIEQIDGVDTKNEKLRDSVERLRGEEGTVVTITVRHPQGGPLRKLAITRGQLPRTTVHGVRKRSTGECDVRIDGPDAIGYLRISDMFASTPHELRKLARQMESEGIRSVVLDLRRLDGTSLHPAVMVADCLLGGGTIGRVRSAQREVTYEADSDAVLRGLPMVVLVDRFTMGTGAWLAAALEDNHRAILVDGARARGKSGYANAVIQSSVPVGDGAMFLTLVTGQLMRANGRSLGVVTSHTEQLNELLREELAASAEAANAAGQRNQPQAKSKRRLEEEPDAAADPAVKKAIQALRESQKKKT